jgi:hypothetical protein
MNQLSDIIMHICNNIIFDGIIDATDETGEKNYTETANMKEHIFPPKSDQSTSTDYTDNKISNKIVDFKSSIEDLIVRLDFINTKKIRLEGPKMIITTIIYIYTVIVFVLLFTYLSYKYGGPEYVSKADNYDIGFVSSTAYIYLFSQLKDHYFEYSELQGQVGHYDEKVCSSISNVILNIKTIYTHLLKLIDESTNTVCVDTITNTAVELYKRIYVNDVFRESRNHFKNTVSSINSFVDKQKRYLLKIHNTNMDEKNNNEYMEDFYNILLKGYKKNLLQVTNADKPIKIREIISGNGVSINENCKITEEDDDADAPPPPQPPPPPPPPPRPPWLAWARNQPLKTVGSFTMTPSNNSGRQEKPAASPESDDLLTSDPLESVQPLKTDELSKKSAIERTVWDKFIITNFIDPVIEMNKIKLDSNNSQFIKHLTTILNFLNAIKNLPEYDQIKKLIFPVKMENHTEFTTDSFIEYINKNCINDQLSENVLQYFKTTVLDYYIDNNLIAKKKDTNTIEVHNSFLSKITKRNSNISTITSRYYGFVDALKSRVLVDDDLTDEGPFGTIFEKITNDFIANTEKYKLNENIVMRYMTFMFKNDEQFNNHKSASLILSNIRFIVSKIMKKVSQTQSIRNDLMDSKNINTNKYISFLNFESKMFELNKTDLENFYTYIKQIKDTIKSFRRYTRTEEILFSKKEQISNVYNKIHRDIFIVLGIIITVYIYEEYFKDKFAKAKFRDILDVGKAVSKAASKAASNVGEAANFVVEKTGKAASFVGKKTGEAAKGTISGVRTAPGSIAATAINTATGVRSAWNKGIIKASDRYKKANDAFSNASLKSIREQMQKQGGTDEEAYSRAAAAGAFGVKPNSNSTEQVKKTGEEQVEQQVEEESQSEKDAKKIEKQLSFNKYITISLIIVVYGIFMTFTKSYLMKYEADLQHDKITNVVNTTKFETEMHNFLEAFEKYKDDGRTTENCKTVYNSLIEVLDIYDKCNFIKSSIKSTPFPAAEMWTNGIVLLIFLAVLYITFIQTDVNSYWDNQNKLDELLNSLDNIGSADDEAEMIKNIDEELNKEKNELDKAIEKYDWHNAKKYIRDIYGINDEFKDKMKKVFKDNTQKTGDNKVSNEDKKAAYQNLINELEEAIQNNEKDEKDKNQQKGGAATRFPMGMIDTTQIASNNNDAKIQKKLLDQYTSQANAVQSQIIKMKRDTKYVNLSMSIMILMFGSYFCVSILNNTRNYQNMLVSSGNVFRNCL